MSQFDFTEEDGLHFDDLVLLSRLVRAIKV